MKSTGTHGAGGGWVGRSVLRREDVRLLTGRGCFVDDVALPSVLHVALVRSPHAHARVVSVDTSAAEGAPGVVCVLTGAEAQSRTDPFQAGVVAPVRYFCMASDRVRYVGEPVVAVVAEDRYLAEDAAELVEVVYEALPAVVSIEDALDPSLPVLHDGMDSNVVVRRELRYGDPEAAFAAADVVVSETLRWERYSSTPIETFGVIADYEPVSGELTVWSNFMGPMTLATIVSRSLRIPESQVRFRVPKDIGGSFGIKCAIFPYITLV
jgi:2-furoyl-CoA dehydrogenase large subunit